MASESSSVLHTWNSDINVGALDPETKNFVALSENFKKKSNDILQRLESHLCDKIVLVGDDLGAADVALVAAMRDHVAKLAKKKAKSKLYTNFPNVTRWFDFCQYQIPEIVKPVDLLQALPSSNKKKPAKKAVAQEKKEAATPEEAPEPEKAKAKGKKSKKKVAKSVKPKSDGNLQDHVNDIDWLQARISKFDEIWSRQEAERQNATGVITVTLPDGREFPGVPNQTTPLDIAINHISKGFSKKCVVAKIFTEDNPEGELWDMSRPLEVSCNIEMKMFDDDEGNETFWHSSAHVLGQSLERLFKGKLTNGPALPKSQSLSQGGFYYDVDMEMAVTEADYKAMEKMCKGIQREAQDFKRIVMTKQEALAMFQENKFKQHFINDKIPDDGTCTAYRCGPLVDLCRGPHISSTKMIGAMKIVKNSSCYWKNNKDNESLQRVYGVSFPDKKKMKQWDKAREQAAKSDHRLKGKDLGLYFFDELSPGCCFWLPHGARIYNRLLVLMREQYAKRGYSEVLTPNMFSIDLWKTSGHAAKYKENMFCFDVEKQEFGLKPMNCPAHCLMFKHSRKSYRDLPIRMADFGVLHRNEFSGSLSGLTRVRRFQQDDAHIFCREDQIVQEIRDVLDFINYIYGIFGFTFELELSTRPEEKLGSDETWDIAEKALSDALDEFCDANPHLKRWRVDPGDGAFYGPKIDIQVFDSMGRGHQCATVQLDFQLPQRFELNFAAENNKQERPVMIHRAILGSVERFTAVLIEHCGGKLPFWISPRQISVIPVSEAKHGDYARSIAKKFHDADLFADCDESSDRLPKKIRNNQQLAYNVIFVVGGDEIENGTVNVRLNNGEKKGEMSVEDAFRWLCDARDNYERKF